MRLYYPLFDIPDNSLAVVWDDSIAPHIFVGCDGKFFLSGTLETEAAYLVDEGVEPLCLSTVGWPFLC